jgi:hypothetical protein
VKIPEGYKGVILSSTDQKLPKEPQTSEEEDELDENEQSEEIGILEEQAEFDEVMVWGHEALPDESTDPYVRGVQEWIAFAEQVCSDSRSQCRTDSFRCTPTLHRTVKLGRNPMRLDSDVGGLKMHSTEMVCGSGQNLQTLQSASALTFPSSSVLSKGLLFLDASHTFCPFKNSFFNC